MSIDRFKALMASRQVSKNALAKNVERLMYGDLSHICDSIINGEEIEYRKSCNRSWDVGIDGFFFASEPECYRVKPQEVSLGGIMIPKPVSEPLPYGAKYFCVEASRKGFFCKRYVWNNDEFDFVMLKSNRMHLNNKNAQKHANALDKLHEF